MDDTLLNILLVDSDETTASNLITSLKSMHRTVGSTIHVRTIAEAKRALSQQQFDVIYIDPLLMDVDAAGDFILTTDRDFRIVFILFIDFATMHQRDHELFRGERKKLRRYFRLDKRTPTATIADEVEATLRNCQYDLELWTARDSLRQFNERFATVDVESNLCLVIMSFSKEKRFEDIYRLGIKAAVEGHGYKCARVDEIEHNNRITDVLIRKLESARFIVADLTDARPNCYYELGWAHRARKEVILTIDTSTEIHFDVRDYNFIVYDSVSDLQDKLAARIAESVGPYTP